MTSDYAYELGDTAGFDDGYDGNSYDAASGGGWDTVPEELETIYRQGYSDGYNCGQDAYRRTLAS